MHEPSVLSQYFSPHIQQPQQQQNENVPANQYSGGTQPEPRQEHASAIGGLSSAPLPHPSSIARNMKFPSFRSVLWDRTPQSGVITVDAEQFLPRMKLPLSVLREIVDAIGDHAVSETNVFARLKARLSRPSVSGGDSQILLCVQSQQHQPIPTEEEHHFVDIEVFHNAEFSAAMYAAFVQKALTQMGSRDTPSFGNYILTRICVLPTSTSCCIYGEYFSPALSISFCEINPLRLVSTPLSMSLQKQTLCGASFQSGYLTLDQYRNAVPILDSDAAAFNSPLVGAWVYGKCTVNDLDVWMSCVRFLYNASIKDRVTVAAMSFLLAVFDTNEHDSGTKVTFYECTAHLKGSRIRHHQFGAEVHSLKSSSSSSSVSLSWHPVLDQSADFRFLQAEQGRVPAAAIQSCEMDERTPATPHERPSLRDSSHRSCSPRYSSRISPRARSSPPRSVSQPSPSPLRRSTALDDDRTPSSMRYSLSSLTHSRGPSQPLPRPQPAISPSPRPQSFPTQMSMSTPVPSYPYWACPHAFYEASPPCTNVPSSGYWMQQQQHQFEKLQQQMAALQKRFDEHFSNSRQQLSINEDRMQNEASTNTSMISHRFVSQSTSTNGLEPRIPPCVLEKRSGSDDVDAVRSVSSVDQSSAEGDAPDTKLSVDEEPHHCEQLPEPQSLREPQRQQDQEQEHEQEQRHSRHEEPSATASHRSQDKQSSHATEFASLSSLASEPSHSLSQMRFESERSSSAGRSRSGKMSLDELDDQGEEHNSSDMFESGAFFDIPRIEFNPDNAFEDSDDEDDDDRIAKRYFTSSRLSDTEEVGEMLRSSSLLMRVHDQD